jgi:hypothetical protein
MRCNAAAASAATVFLVLSSKVFLKRILRQQEHESVSQSVEVSHSFFINKLILFSADVMSRKKG